MSGAPADILVLFGATGNLADKKTFPALQAMVKSGRLEVPVVCVAKEAWTLEQLKARVHKSLEKHGGGVDGQRLLFSCFGSESEVLCLAERRHRLEHSESH